jgi:hypothetical protein
MTVQRIEIDKQFIPDGAILIEVYETPTEYKILGEPPNDENLPEELQHNCDKMGCGTLSHVIIRINKKDFRVMH